VDRLWRHELDALPLTTPEARAGFRQRMGGHAQAIENANVREQYQAEFRARFDALFSRRTPQNSGPRPLRGNRFQPFERPPGTMARSIGGAGIEPLYARAILNGLLHYPAVISAHAELIATLTFSDQDQARLRDTLIDAAFSGLNLESEALIPICEQQGLGGLARALKDANSLAFSFTRRQADAALAQRDLGMVIEVLAARPMLDSALSAATARLAEQWDEVGFAEQTRLLEERRAADQRLAALVQPDMD
jgi:DNA primase